MTAATMNARFAARVSRVRAEADDICALELVAEDGRSLPAFTAGAHIEVQTPSGFVRQYSLCNDPAELHRYVIAVLKDPATRGGSVSLHEQVKAGDVLQISAPKNHFPLADEHRDVILLAGGIGITPIMCMAEQLSRAGTPFELHYATRGKSRTAFYERLRRSAYAGRTRFHFDDDTTAQRLDLAALFAAADPSTHVYVCGPKGFIDAVLASARAAGWPESSLHHEFFGAVAAPAGDDEAFTVKLARTGRAVLVPQGMTVVEALREAGLDLVPTSCEQGICGVCVTGVLAGTPDHRDLCLSEEERAANDRFLPCCSRATGGPLVLDL